MSGEMDFVASNGAQVVVAGQLVDREVFSHAALRRLKNVTDLFDGLRLVAFGDSMNDYEIMRMVGTSIAMGNGRSAIKEISTKVIGPNTEHAVQRELEALLSMMGK